MLSEQWMNFQLDVNIILVAIKLTDQTKARPIAPQAKSFKNSKRYQLCNAKHSSSPLAFIPIQRPTKTHIYHVFLNNRMNFYYSQLYYSQYAFLQMKWNFQFCLFYFWCRWRKWDVTWRESPVVWYYTQRLLPCPSLSRKCEFLEEKLAWRLSTSYITFVEI